MSRKKLILEPNAEDKLKITVDKARDRNSNLQKMQIAK